MDKDIELDIEMWGNIKNMILSNDIESSSLAFGILKNLDYNDESNKINFEKLIEDVKEKETPIARNLNKLIYIYHVLYSKN
jgi:hypothetical protein